MTRARWWLLLGGLLVAAVLLRAALLLAAPDQLHDGGDGASGRVYHEELLRGVAARDIAEGSLLPWIGWQVNDFWGGSLVVSLLAAPLYQLFGDHLLCLRAVGVLFQLLLAVFAWCWLSERASRVAATVAALLIVAPPWGYLASSLMVYGTHLELCALQVLVAWTHLRGGGGRLGWIAKGALAGFATWFGYSTVVVLGCVVVAAALDRVRPTRDWMLRALLPWAAGALVGLAPLFLRLAYSGGVVGVYDGGLLHHLERGLLHGTPRGLDGAVVHGPLEKWLLLWSGELAQAAFLPWWGGVALVLLVLASALSNISDRSTAETARGRWSEPGRFALLAAFAWTVSYAVSDFGLGTRAWVFDWRYLMPLWPWGAIILAVACSRWLASPRALPRWSGVALLCLPPCFALHAGMQLAPERRAASIAAPGSDDRVLERFLALQITANPDTLSLSVAALQSLGQRAERSEAEYDRSRALAESLARGIAWVASAPIPEGLENRAEAEDRKDRSREALRQLTEGPARPFQWTFGDAWGRLHESSSEGRVGPDGAPGVESGK